MEPRPDVVVVGAGPAGLAAAASCAEAGLEVTVLAEDHDRAWPQTLAVWTDEVEPLGLSSTLAGRWPDVAVHLGEPAPRRLHRPYGRFDNTRLQGLLQARALRAGARLVSGRAAGAEHAPWGTTVVTDGGARLPCRVAVDASGHRPVLLARGRGRPPAYQAAYGLIGRFRPPATAGGALLMDYRDPPADRDDPAPDHPTFLYGMELGDGHHLLEETSLARRPALGHDALRSRLHRRLDAMGVQVEQHVADEHVLIPMGGPLPAHDQRVVGFGAAAGMVHPATGYQVGAALTRAPLLAAALGDALERRDSTPATVAAAGWDALWPPDLLRQRALHLLGLESLLRLDRDATRRFFRTFFELPQPRWSGFLSGEESAGQLAWTMLMLFTRAPAGVRARLMSTAARHAALLRGAAGG